LKATKAGALNTKTIVTADGGLRDEATAAANVVRLSLNLQQKGPNIRYVSSRFTWEILVDNTSDQPIENVTIRNTLPPEVGLVRAYDNGQQVGNDVVWNLGTLERNGKRRLRVEVEAKQITKKTSNKVVATFGPNLTEKADAEIELRGIPALLMLAEQSDRKGTITVGDSTSYTITINNTGSQKVGKVIVRVKVSPELRLVKALDPNGNPAQIQGDTVVFTLMNDLLPTNAFNYQLELQGIAPGDGRLNIEMESDLTGKEPVRDVEQISVIK